MQHAPFGARASGHGHDVTEPTTVRAGLLNTSPTTQTHPVDIDCAVVRREGRAVKLAIWEWGVNAVVRVAAEA